MLNSSIYIGEDVFIPREDIIAIMDFDTVCSSKVNTEFIKKNKDKIFHFTKKKLKTYVLTYLNGDISIYESSISSLSIKNKYKVKGLNK